LGMLTLLLIQIAAFVLMFLMQSANKHHNSEFTKEWLKLIDTADSNR